MPRNPAAAAINNHLCFTMPLPRGFFARRWRRAGTKLTSDLGAAAAEFQRFAGREKESFNKKRPQTEAIAAVIVRSIPDGKTLPGMLRLFEFVHRRDREILKRDFAVAFAVDQKLVLAEPELSGALAEIDQRRRRQEGPVEILFPRRRSRKTPPLAASSL